VEDWLSRIIVCPVRLPEAQAGVAMAGAAVAVKGAATAQCGISYGLGIPVYVVHSEVLPLLAAGPGAR